MSDLRDEETAGLDDTPADRPQKVVGHPRSWLGKLGLAAVASSWATNVFSGWLGFPGLVGILAFFGVVAAATWIHTLDPRAPLPQYASWLFITPAACLAAIAAFSSGSSALFLTIVVAVLTVGAVLMTNDLLSVARLLEGTAFVAMGAGGIAFGSAAIAHRYALLGSATIALGTTFIAYGAATISDRGRLVEAAKNMRFIACIPFAVAIAVDPSPRVGATMGDDTRPLLLGASIALTVAVLAWWTAIISRRRKLAAGALTAVGAGFFAFGAAAFANRATLEGMSSIALGAASIALSVAIINPRAIVTRIRQVVDWATKVPQESDRRPDKEAVSGSDSSHVSPNPSATSTRPSSWPPLSGRSGARRHLTQERTIQTAGIQGTADVAVQQGSTATERESSRLRRTPMDGHQVLGWVFSNVSSMCLRDGMQKVRGSKPDRR